MTMREWWIGVTPYGLGFSDLNDVCQTRERSAAMDNPYEPSAYRLHVKLKPEGAPKRYESDVERYAWERAERRGIPPRYV